MWKKHPVYDDLELSSDGRARRVRYIKKYKEVRRYNLKPKKSTQGYFLIKVKIGKRWKYRPLHQLVLETFVGPRPQGYITRHLDSNKENNNIENLRWGTYYENHIDRVKAHTSAIHPAKLTPLDVREIRVLLKHKVPLRQIGDLYGVDRGTIRDIKLNKTWKWLE